MREARVRARRAQAARLGGDDVARGLAAILEIEALCDAYADDLTEDFGLDREAWMALVAERIRNATGLT